ncbi:MAG: hypothetical protein RBU30_05455 [Polyangia bacterium]|nr:hypothetical protein [Polyangia bacterium]
MGLDRVHTQDKPSLGQQDLSSFRTQDKPSLGQQDLSSFHTQDKPRLDQREPHKATTRARPRPGPLGHPLAAFPPLPRDHLHASKERRQASWPRADRQQP